MGKSIFASLFFICISVCSITFAQQSFSVGAITTKEQADTARALAESVRTQLHDEGVAYQNATTEVEQNRIEQRIETLNNRQAELEASISKYESTAPSLCATPEKKAVSTCSLGLDPIAEAQLRATMAQASAMIRQGGTEKTCKAANMVQTVAAGANFAHAAVCGAAIKACKTACGEHVTNPTPSISGPAKKSLANCEEMESRTVASIQSGVQNMLGIAMSEKCQKAVTTNQPVGTPPPGMDCSSPAMASLPTCICAANPANPVCTASNGGLGDGGFSSVGDGSGAIDGGGKDPEMFGFDEDLPQQAASNTGGAASAGSSGGGGGMNGGGGAGALPPEEMGGAGTGPYNTDVMGGLTGGGGGGGSSFGRGGSGEGSSGGGLLDGLAAKFNLKGFLPSKGDFKNRGLAGMGADGITGPNGPSLFEKVSSRYMKKQSELLP